MARQRRSQADLADALGHSQMYFSRRLTGELPFAIDDLIAIAGWLGVDVTSFLSRVAA